MIKNLSETILCACGCGQHRRKWRSNKPGDYRVSLFIKGHTNKGKSLSEKHKQHIGESNKGRRFSKKIRSERSKATKLAFQEGKRVPYWRGKRHQALIEGRKRWVNAYIPKKRLERKNEGKFMSSDGYVFVYDEERKKYIQEHRWNMEQHFGRKLLPTEDVHHIDGDRANNTIENLMIFPNRSSHIKFHSMYGYPSGKKC